VWINELLFSDTWGRPTRYTQISRAPPANGSTTPVAPKDSLAARKLGRTNELSLSGRAPRPHSFPPIRRRLVDHTTQLCFQVWRRKSVASISDFLFFLFFFFPVDTRASAYRVSAREIPWPRKTSQVVGIRAGRSSLGARHCRQRMPLSGASMIPPHSFESSPDARQGTARDCGFVGLLRSKWPLTTFVCFVHRDEGAPIFASSVLQIPTHEAGDLALSLRGPSCSISRAAIMACCGRCNAPRGRRDSHDFSALSTL